MINVSPLAREFWEKGRLDDCPVIDMHGHMDRLNSIWFPHADIADMIGAMDSAGVAMLVLASHPAVGSVDYGNQSTIDAVRRYPDRIRGYMAINPNYPDDTKRDLKLFDTHPDVFVGFKVHPGWHATPLSHAGYQYAFDFADERGLLVLSHTWGETATDGSKFVKPVVDKYSRLKFLAGHCMFGEWDEGIAIARDHDNFFLELTAVLNARGPVEKFVEAGLSERMLFGTDLPWFAPHHGIGAVLSADITDDDRRNILHRNADTLLASINHD